MRYILTGGGTGGHVYPALAIAEQIKKNEPDAEFLYVGTKDHIESTIVPARGYRIKFISARGMPSKKLSAEMMLFAVSLFTGILKSFLIILSFRPDMIIGSGGFVSAPPVFAGHILRKLGLSRARMFLHEANAEAGKLVKAAGPMCDGVGVSYRVSLKDFPKNGRFVGYPVRPEFYEGSRTSSRVKLGIGNDKFVVFAVGGSQGARTINRAVADSLPYLKDVRDLVFIHVTGRGTPQYNGVLDTIRRLEKNNVRESDIQFYKRTDYAQNIKDYYFAADLIITRGGGTVNEIAVSATPSLIIPKANLSGDHQVMNAISMKNSGCSDIIYEEVMPENEKLVIKVEGKCLAEKIRYYYENRDVLDKMTENARSAVMKDSNSEIYRFIRDIRENRTSAAAEAAGAQNNPFAEKNSASLLKALQKMSSEEIRSSEFYNYLSYRSSHYLISSDWNVRNNAVKMCGLLKDPEKIPLMSRILRNEKKGFIRRNIISSYIKTGVYSETVESDIYNGLSDTYWEVAAESLKAVWIFHEDTVSNDKIESRVKELLNSGNFEILLNAVGAYQVYISGPDGIAQLRKFYFHDNWKIREAVMTALNELKKRKIIDPVELKKEIDSMLLVSSGFTPVFMMKKKVRDIQL